MNIIDCKNCELYKNQKPLLDKTKECDIMWVGLSAKKVDNVDTNIPLSINTNSGYIINKYEENINKYIKNKNLKFYKTNLVKCLPLDKKGKSRYPNNNEMKKCIDNLIYEIEILKPKIIFLLGNKVYNFVSKYIESKNTSFKRINFKNIYYLEHPSYIYIYKRKELEKYTEKVLNIIKNTKEI